MFQSLEQKIDEVYIELNRPIIYSIIEASDETQTLKEGVNKNNFLGDISPEIHPPLYYRHS